MYAYSQVDTQTRRKLEELLKTWREPIQNSLSTTPVFPISSTQPIVDTLNRYRTSTPQLGRGPQSFASNSPYQGTSTPPQTSTNTSQSGHENVRPFVHSIGTSAFASQPPYQHTPMNHQASSSLARDARCDLATDLLKYLGPSPAFAPPSHTPLKLSTQEPVFTPQASNTSLPHHPPSAALRPPSASGRSMAAGTIDMENLHEGIDDLTTDAKIECATHPMDQSARTKLASLQSLKEIIEGGAVSEKDLLDIRDSILQQKAQKLASQRPTPPPAENMYPHSITQGFRDYQPQPTIGISPPASATPSFLSQTNLAELLRATAPSNGVMSQGPRQQLHRASVPTPPLPQMPPSRPGELPLLAQLRASGLLSATATSPQSSTPSVLARSDTLTPTAGASDLNFTSASMKIPRPHLVTTFLNTRPNQCATCGRRFASDDNGKAEKSRHLDWHFKTRTRMVEAESRAQNRSWYVDEREWIASKEYDDDDGQSEGLLAVGHNAINSQGVQKIEDYVRAPSEPTLRGEPCPIDLEPFKSEWNEELQDFIWKDAVSIAGRYYHASCYREYMHGREKDKDHAGTITPIGAGRTSPPDSVLGKRKAEVGSNDVPCVKRLKHADAPQVAVNGVSHHKVKQEA